MAGVKGRSGGARPGAGRKPKPPAMKMAEPKGAPAAKPAAKTSKAKAEPDRAEMTVGGGDLPRDPMEFLLGVMQGRIEPNAAQLKAAMTAARIQAAVPKGGKKEEQAEQAQKVASGRFGAVAPPRLVAKNGKAA